MMSKRKQTADEIRENLAEQLNWRFAERDDIAVAQALYQGKPVDAVHTLDEAGLLDGFFEFLRESEIMEHWQTISIEAVQRIFLPAIYFILLYGTRVLFGIESNNALPSLLFSNVAVMKLLGFNARQIAEGMTQRGNKLRTGAKEYALMDPQTLANKICKINAQELERLFNGTIKYLAAFGVFSSKLSVGVDGTRVETTKHFPGCGCLTVDKKKYNKQGKLVKYVERYFGWRLIALIDLTTLIPVAIKIVQIQKHEAPYMVELVKQAQANLDPYSQICRVVADRAYVDGPRLYKLERMGIIFTVTAKSNMAAATTALALSAKAPIHERIESVRHGYANDTHLEEQVTRVKSATGIRTWENYRPPKVSGERLAWQDRPALNAVIVTLWRNKAPGKDGPRVYLTNGCVDNPWITFDAYDDRSWIENGLFRNSKQFWSLTRWFPMRTEEGVRSHVTFVMLMVAVATAYRLWDKAQSGATHPVLDRQVDSVTHRVVTADTGEIIDLPTYSHPTPTHLASSVLDPQVNETDLETSTAPPADFLAHSLLGGQGPLRWRRQLQRENRDKVIVFIDHLYGIFDTHEFLILSGVPLRTLPPHLDSRQDVLRRYGCDSCDTSDVSIPDT
jgi:hypothetical protein